MWLSLLLFSNLITIYLLWAGFGWHDWRPVWWLVPLLLLASWGANRLRHHEQRLYRGGIQLLSLLVFCATFVWMAWDVREFTAWRRTQLTTAVWLRQQLPPEATVLAFGPTQTIQDHTDLHAIPLDSLTETELAEVVSGQITFYLLVDPQEVLTNWQGQQPELNVRWLDEQRDLLQIGRSGSYVLYWIVPKPPATFIPPPLLNSSK